ncbi:glycosyltransferase [Cryptosporangium minutisporangium]|uniref:Glycosyltransferase family 1 protein n=1 Tax=Cryptosporangium minutisporangium TaxID=113569 RepID=A0ABP6SVX2_9ACTN
MIEPGAGPATIVRLANFVGPRSGGLRTALHELGRGYRAAGHHPVLVVPGPRATDEDTPQGRVITLPGPTVPWMGGYRVVVGRRRLAALLEELRPDRLEVSDRTTLRWTGGWARRHGVASVMVSHENLTALLGMALPPWAPTRRVADQLNQRTAASFDAVVATTEFAAGEFRRIGAAGLVKVPLGVDLSRFHPGLRDVALRGTLARPSELLLVHCGRLSPEKRVERSVDALAALRARGVAAVLVVVGDGPRRPALERRARGLPVRFLGFVPDRGLVARLLATADAVLAPGPAETFGLAALEAMACGTPVVAAGDGALGEVIGDAGVAVPGTASSGTAGIRFAEAVLELAARPEADRRSAARQRAQRFDWPTAVSGMLAAHNLEPLETFEEVASWPGSTVRASASRRSGIR